jgi:hypothetical protein
MVKPGIKTTEFWLTAVAALLLGWVKTYVIPDLPDETFYAIIAYILGRSWVKVKEIDKEKERL